MSESRMLVRREFLLGVAGGIMALAWPGAACAAPRVEADPQKTYPITPQAGQWVILCSSYTGAYAPELGRQVTLWLRQKGLLAFAFDKGEQERQQQEREIEEMKRANPGARARRVRIEEQCAVLVGGFKDQDAATEALKSTIRKLPPPEVNLPNVLSQDYLFYKTDKGFQRFAINPFASAMVVPNPTMPLAKPEQKVDPFLKDLNEGEPDSLLTNKSPWTLLVRDYTGACVIQPTTGTGGGLADKLGFSSHRGNALEAAGKQAQMTAKALRFFNYKDVYVLHTREASMVTVGGFDGPSDPRINDLAEQLSRDKRLEVLQLMQPMMALEVPRP